MTHSTTSIFARTFGECPWSESSFFQLIFLKENSTLLRPTDMSNIGERLATPLSPFEKLPLDIIGEIFIACLDPNVPSPMSPREVPLLLTMVSPYLRHAAINTPKLWASISIFDASAPSKSTLAVSLDDVSCVQLRTEAAKVWLRRSGGMPLSIQYAGPSGYPAHIDELLEEAMTDLFFELPLTMAGY